MLFRSALQRKELIIKKHTKQIKRENFKSHKNSDSVPAINIQLVKDKNKIILNLQNKLESVRNINNHRLSIKCKSTNKINCAMKYKNEINQKLISRKNTTENLINNLGDHFTTRRNQYSNDSSLSIKNIIKRRKSMAINKEPYNKNKFYEYDERDKELDDKLGKIKVEKNKIQRVIKQYSDSKVTFRNIKGSTSSKSLISQTSREQIRNQMKAILLRGEFNKINWVHFNF